MKGLTLFSAFVLSALGLKAQNGNVIIFTEKGEKFIAILNGLRYNDAYQTNVLLKDLNQGSYKLKVLWENSSVKPIYLNLYVKRGVETQYSLKRNSKGKYVLRFAGEAPLPPPSTVVNQPSTTPPNATGGVINNGTQVNVPINVNVNVGGVQNNVSAGGSPLPLGVNQPTGNPCGMPMTNNDFQFAKSTISSKGFEDSKLQIAKQIVRDNCMLASQIREIMLLFNLEDSRLDFAKFAYPNCVNQGNYYEVNSAFNFESSIKELNRYVKNLR